MVGWVAGGFVTLERIGAQHLVKTLGSLAASPGYFTLWIRFLAIIFSFFHYSKFWFIDHNTNESLSLLQLSQFYLLLHFRELAVLKIDGPGCLRR